MLETSALEARCSHSGLKTIDGLFLRFRFSLFTYVCFLWLGLRAGLAASIAGSSIINKMLLANIDPFGATPFIDPDPDSV